VSFSPDATRVAFGGADKVLRVVRLSEGRELFRFDQHTDWVLATAFTLDGKRVVTGGRDKSIKLVDADSGKFVDEINKPVEAVLCLARHPKREEIVFGGDGGTVRTYKIPEKPVRTEGNDNVYQLKELDRLPGPVQAIAYSPSGDSIAVGGSSDEARIYKTDGARVATLKGHQGAIFAIAFRPDGQQIVTGGLDGHVRFYDAKSGKLVSQFVPVPLRPRTSTAAVR
jgi:WD40 repeat protein